MTLARRENGAIVKASGKWVEEKEPRRGLWEAGVAVSASLEHWGVETI